MSILYILYFGRLTQLSSSDVENPGMGAPRRPCRVVYVNTQGLHKALSDLSLIARGGDADFCSKILVSSGRHISELIILIGSSIQLFRGKVDQISEFAAYVRDSLSAYRQCSYECGCCEVIVVRICSSSHNLFCFAVCWNQDQ